LQVLVELIAKYPAGHVGTHLRLTESAKVLSASGHPKAQVLVVFSANRLYSGRQLSTHRLIDGSPYIMGLEGQVATHFQVELSA
jgi:hypothetical protein